MEKELKNGCNTGTEPLSGGGGGGLYMLKQKH
jgi:hypothetical protein